MAEEFTDVGRKLHEAAADLGVPCLVLLQGYPATTLAQLSENGLKLPPIFHSVLDNLGNLPWQLFWDVRAFGPGGEFHAWKGARGLWKMRMRPREIAERDRIERLYPLWGRPSGPPQDGWVLYSEDRGADVWVPAERAGGADRLVLKVWQIIGGPQGLPDELQAGVVSIIDAMIVELIPSSHLEAE